MRSDTVTVEELKECLYRSGYLLESRLVRSLVDKGYIVEPSEKIVDQSTGKDREIDVVAEPFPSVDARYRLDIKTKLVIEALNTRFPLVLLSPRPWSPNSVVFESLPYRWSDDERGLLTRLLMHSGDAQSQFAFDINDKKWAFDETLYSQYCGITRKSGQGKELMAYHSDDMHAAIQKVVRYIHDDLDSFDQMIKELGSGYRRIWFWKPMLVVSGDIYIVEGSSNKNSEIDLIQVKAAKLVHNWFDRGTYCSSIIDIVTEDAFSNHVDEILFIDQGIRQMIVDGLSESVTVNDEENT